MNRLIVLLGIFTGFVTFACNGAGLPTIEDSGIPVEQLRQSPAFLWVYPKSTRVDLERHDSNDFEFTLPKFPESEPQKGEDWCWAYCASQVLKYNRIKATPEDLVEKLRSRRKEKSKSKYGDAGTVLDIIRPLMGPGRFVGIYTPDAAQLARSITMDSPVIVSLAAESKDQNGHAVVVTGIRFSMIGSHAFPSDFTVYDPLNGSVKNIEATEIAKRMRKMIYFIKP